MVVHFQTADGSEHSLVGSVLTTLSYRGTYHTITDIVEASIPEGRRPRLVRANGQNLDSLIKSYVVTRVVVKNPEGS